MEISKIIEKNKNAIVLIAIEIPKENNQTSIGIRGTGFIVSEDGKFITNAHVYKQIPENELQYIVVKVPGKTDDKKLLYYDTYPIKLLQIDEENDVALIQIVTDKKFETVDKMGNSDEIQEGDEVVYIGYPLATEMLQMGFGITMTTNRCLVSSIKRRGIDGSLHFFLVDTHTNNGSSGSPVFSTETGKVVGIASAKISSRIPTPDGKIIDIPANIGICRPIKYAIDLINKK